jgi:uncharacterized membrane protein YhaH (DUF805 family)
MEWVIDLLRNYAQFNGRAARREFWAFFLIFSVVTIGAHALDARGGQTVFVAAGMGMLELVAFVLLLLPFLSVSVRRLHDCGRSGWWLLLFYLPYLGFVAARGNEGAVKAAAGALVMGALMLGVMLCLPGDATENRFGAPPRKPSI